MARPSAQPWSVVAFPRMLIELLERQEGVVRRADVLALLGPDRTRWLVTSGRWQRPVRGVLVGHSGPLSSRRQLWVGLLGCGTAAVLAGLTAAVLDGYRVPVNVRVPDVQVLLLPGVKRTVPGVVVRRSASLGLPDVHPSRRPPRTRLGRSLVDAASWARTDDEARAIVAAGFQQRLVRGSELVDVLARRPSSRRRVLVLSTVADAVGGSHAVGELDALRLCRRFGLPEPTRQARRLDAHGRARWLDLCFDEYGLVVEIDGLWHMDVESWWADLRRLNEHVLQGEALLRFPAFLLRDEPETVARVVAQALRSRGWRGACRLLAS